jgi:hypothetical protein
MGRVRRSEMTLECALRYVTPRWYAICLMRMAVGGRGDARSVQGEADTMSDYDIKMQVTDSAKEFW